MPSFLPAGLPLNTWLMLTSCILLAFVLGFLVVVGYWLRELKVQEKRLSFLGDDVTRALLSAKTGMDSLKSVAQTALPELQKKISEADNAVQDLKFLISRAEQVAEKLEKMVELTRGNTPKFPEITPKEMSNKPKFTEVEAKYSGMDAEALGENTALRAAIVRAAAVIRGGDGDVAPGHGLGGRSLDVKPPAVLVPVVQANGEAALSATEPSRPNPRDPLDELLAGLSEANRVVGGIASAMVSSGEGGSPVRRGPVSQAELDLRKKMGGVG